MGDQIIIEWERFGRRYRMSQAVNSVNGYTGVVVLDEDATSGWGTSITLVTRRNLSAAATTTAAEPEGG